MKGWNENDLKGLGIKITTDGKVSLHDKNQNIDEFAAIYRQGKGVFIPHEVMSSKRGKQLFTYQKEGKTTPGQTDSKQVKEYRSKTKDYYEILSHVFRKELAPKKMPYFIEFKFVRRTNAEWDFHNMVQLPCDMMQEFHWLPGDDVKVMFAVPPMNGEPYLVNSKAPGVWIKIL